MKKTGASFSFCVIFRAFFLLLAVALFFAISAQTASAQIRSTPPSKFPEFNNAIGMGISYGPFIGRDATFWGLAVDYTRRLPHGWSVAASLAYDMDTERFEDGSTKKIQALNAVGIVNYSFDKFTLTTGLSKGFANDDNLDRSFQLASGDWGTGIVFGISLPDLPWTARDVLGLSVGYEYNLSQKEADISFDFGIGFAF
jgi:hypothetical protein